MRMAANKVKTKVVTANETERDERNYKEIKCKDNRRKVTTYE